jgi:hypothetical protein
MTNLQALSDYGIMSDNIVNKHENNKNNGNNEQGNLTPIQQPIDTNVYVVWQDNTLGNYSIFFTSSHDNGTTFSTPINLSNNTKYPLNTQIVSEGNNVYVLWLDNTLGNYSIFFTSSHDNGTTFSTPINLRNDTDVFLVYPQIVSEGNNVYVVWQEDDDDAIEGDLDIFFTSSHDNGTTFSTPINLSNDTRRTMIPQILSKGNNVSVAWVDYNATNSRILFTASNDTGQTFSTPINISNNTGVSDYPKILTAENNVYVVWEVSTYDIFFSTSHDNGQTFSTPINLNNNTKNSAVYPQISSEGNNVYVVWLDLSLDKFDISFTSSHDNGTTFSTPINLNLSNDTKLPKYESQISSKGNNVFVAWLDHNATNNNNIYRILFTASNDTGQTFSTPINLSNDTRHKYEPQISSKGNNVFVAWQDYTLATNDDNINRIFFAASNDTGQTFSPTINLIYNGSFDSSHILSAENNIYVTWTNYIFPSVLADIFFTASHDNSQTFSTPIKLSNNTGISINPQISIEGK